MAERENVQGEGFEMVGHEPPAREEPAPEGKEPAEEAGPQPEAEQAAAPEGAEAAVAKPDIYLVLRLFINELERLAWWNLGLQPNPFTGAVERDTAQAKVTIDSLSALADQLLPHLQGQEARDLRNLVTNLRLNYVKQAEA